MNPDIDVQIDLNVTSYIPDEYIKDSSQKIEVYQNIALCKNEEDIQNVVDEIIDRYGNMPKELENLLAIARIKYLAKSLKISKISNKKLNNKSEVAVFTFEPNQFNIDVVELVKKYGIRIKVSPGVKPMITFDTKTNNEIGILNEITKFLKNL